MEEKRGYFLDAFVVQETILCGFALEDMYNRDHHRSFTWPLVPLYAPVYATTILANPLKPSSSSVPLSNRVCRNETHGSARPEQREGPSKETGGQIHVAVSGNLG